MAKPIKETPILEGQDAKKFLEGMKESNIQKVDEDTILRMKSNYEKIKSKTNLF